MQSDRWLSRIFLLFLLGALVTMVGCPPGGKLLPPVTDDVPAETAIARVNRNVRAMSFLLRAGGVSASGKVVRSSGKKESFDASGTLFFRRPRNLYMELKHSLAGKIEMGSNDEEFWYWERLDQPRYYTGRHSLIGQPWETDIPLRPDQFVDMFGFRELPTASDGPGGPVFEKGADYYYLNFFERDRTGRLFRNKSVAISRRPPFLVSSVTYYDPHGQPWMTARLEEYRPIEGTLVLAPRRIEVQSFQDQSRLRLEFGNMKPSDNQVVEKERIEKSPLVRHEEVGEIVRLDRGR